MQHRYIVWEGHWHGRRFGEMHIIGLNDKPICASWKYPSIEHETIYKGRPDGYPLCRYCARKRADFEAAEKLRTWQALSQEPAP